VEDITIDDLYNGKVPKGWISIDNLNPNLTGQYETICIVGSMSAKVQQLNKFYKMYDYKDENGKPVGRWIEGDWIKVMAWKERKI